MLAFGSKYSLTEPTGRLRDFREHTLNQFITENYIKTVMLQAQTCDGKVTGLISLMNQWRSRSDWLYWATKISTAQ